MIELNHLFIEIAYSFNPVTMFKDTLHTLIANKDVQYDMARVGLNIGSKFIIDKVFGRNRSIKDFWHLLF